MIDRFKFWGAATVGTKGQVVIPAEARENLYIKEGDKLLLVSPPGSNAIVIVRPDVLEEYMQQMQANVKDILKTSNDVGVER